MFLKNLSLITVANIRIIVYAEIQQMKHMSKVDSIQMTFTLFFFLWKNSDFANFNLRNLEMRVCVCSPLALSLSLSLFLFFAFF